VTANLLSLPDLREARAAIILCAAGEPIATRLLARLDSDDLKRLDELASRIGSIPSHDLNAVVEEFADTMVSTVGLQSAAMTVARLIQATLNPQQPDGEPAAAIPLQIPAKELLEALSCEDLVDLLAKESAPIATALLSIVSSTTAAAALQAMPALARLRLMRNMLAAKQITDHGRELLDRAVSDALAKAERPVTGKERHIRIASIVNRLEDQQIAEIVTDFERTDPQSAGSIRGLLFTFQDIAKLTTKARATLFDKVPTEQMVLALQGADAVVRDLVLSSLTARGRRMIEAELSSRSAPPASEVKAAKRAICDLALDMSARGEIEIPAGTDDKT
jgi:flagellar motor switch protein FliG